ncbi:MAG: glycosyltransferase family 2 protein [Planctomycetia bacterium]|jgi:dolichol-phosphate mannosyltransferase
MLVSLVIPVLNESENVGALWSRLRDVTAHIQTATFEAVFVDDGSIDDTVDRISTLPTDEHLSWLIVRLSRNFGHQAAITAGMAHATGDAVIFLDADLQDPPELIATFLEHFLNGYDVVYGVRKNRKEPLWLRFCFATFYRLFNAIAERPIPLDAGDFGLMSKRVAKLIAQMPERDRLIRGMRSWVGFKQIGVPYDRPGRYAGTTRYSVLRRIEGALDGLFGYSRLPIRVALLLGTMVCLAAGIYMVFVLVGSLVFGGQSVPGWKSLLVLAFMLGGANLIATSIVGEYVCRIYFQSKDRPIFVVAETHRPQPQPATSRHSLGLDGSKGPQTLH